MKKLALLFTLCILASASVFAQKKSKKSPEERAEKQITRMTEELDLTEEQVTKLRPAITTRIQKVQEAKKTENTANVKVARKEFREVLKATLTEEQFAKHKQLKKERRAKHKGRKGMEEMDEI